MKKRVVLFAIALFVAQAVFAADYYEDFCKELNRNNLRNIENLLSRRARQMELARCMSVTIRSPRDYDKYIGNFNTDKFNKANCLDVLRLLVRYGADVNDNYLTFVGSSLIVHERPLEAAVKEKHSLAVIQFLLDSGANPNLGYNNPPLYIAYQNNDMTLMNLLLDRGANGALLLPYLGSSGNNQMIQQLISRGVQIRSTEGASALQRAAINDHLDTVKLLVENGVNVNARNGDGDSAASLAYSKGEIEIYNYLKSKGAIDFEPRQVVVQPAAPASSTTNVYVTPSASAQNSSSSSSPTPSSSPSTGRAIADALNRAFEAPLENGRYKMSGRTEEIVFSGIAKTGTMSYKDAAGTTHRGTYSIDDTRLQINVMNRTFFYTVSSKTSFTGHGETWFRSGF